MLGSFFRQVFLDTKFKAGSSICLDKAIQGAKQNVAILLVVGSALTIRMIKRDVQDHTLTKTLMLRASNLGKLIWDAAGIEAFTLKPEFAVEDSPPGGNLRY